MGLIGTAAKVAVASSVHGRVQRRQQQRWAAQDAATSAPAGPAPQDPAAAHLAALSGLLSAGIISHEEFTTISARIYG